MRRSALGALAVVAAPSLWAQTVVGLHGVYVTDVEVNQQRAAQGPGVGGLLSAQLGRFAIELSGYTASLDPSHPESGMTGFSIREGDARASMLVAPTVAIQVGAGRRMIHPALAAQDVGFMRVGLASESRLTNIANLRLRGAYLVAPRFSGGGDAGLAFEIGLGVGLGRPDGRVRFQTDYDFQRIDRQVGNANVPMQSLVARAGVVLGF